MEFSKVLDERYSARSYKSTPVEDEKIIEILNAGRIAPTGKNTQCQRLYVFKSKEALEKIKKITPCSFDAPLVILTCGDENHQCTINHGTKSLMETDVAIVHTYMMLKATELGLGTCWVCLFDRELIKKEFNIPENIKPYNLLIVGYKSDDCVPNERHNIKNNLEDIVTYL